jgi:hypothetical protein
MLPHFAELIITKSAWNRGTSLLRQLGGGGLSTTSPKLLFCFYFAMPQSEKKAGFC